MMLDVFRTDAFHFTKLVSAINLLKYLPTRIGDMGIFVSKGISTLTCAIELQGDKLTLVPTAPRGSRGPAKNQEKRTVRDFRPVHLPQSVAVMADEVQGLRAFGTEDETVTAMNYLMGKMAVARRDLDLTHEYQRVGAIRGQVLDADGVTVIYDYFNEFGLTRTTHSSAWTTSTTKPIQEILAMKRKGEDKLGGTMTSGWRGICSPEYFDAFTGHAQVAEAFKYQASQVLRSDNRTGFEFGQVMWEEYRGSVNGTPLIPAGKAYLVPMGVPDLFQTIYAPADYMDTVNTIGVPFYTMPEDLPFNKGIEYEVQSNPLHLNTRPDAIVELSFT